MENIDLDNEILNKLYIFSGGFIAGYILSNTHIMSLVLGFSVGAYTVNYKNTILKTFF